MNTTTHAKPPINWRGIRAMIRKDLKVVLRTKALLLPLILVPLIVQVIMPAGFAIMASFLPLEETAGEIEDLESMFAAMPASITEQLEGLDARQLFLVLMLVYLFAPMYLIVPLMVSSVFAADSFAGEKERKTLEALLHSPLTDSELIIGKMLGAWLPAVAVSVGSFILYTLVANGAGWPVMGRIFFPNLMWIILVFWVAPAAAAVGLSASVLVSSKVKTFQEAYQLSGLVVLPMIILMLGQISGALFLSPLVTAIIGVVLWLVAAALIWFSIQVLQRTELIAKL